MGQGGKVKIVNNTDSQLVRSYCGSYQMDAWNFPETIAARSSCLVYVEWDEYIFHAKGDDRGSVYYTLRDCPSKRVEITMYDANSRNFTVTRIGFNGIPAKPEKVQWLHNGIMTVIIDDPPAEEDKDDDKTNVDDGGNKEMTLKNWMSRIDDETPLNKIDIPGTHDSFAYCVPYAVIESTAKTQSMNILDQLNIGCRFLDIRVNQNLEGRHASIDCKDDLWKAMEWIKSFLAENPKETILMRIKLEDEDNLSILDHNLGTLLTEYGKLFWMNGGKTEWPAIKEVRGKIVVLDNLTNNDDFYFFSRGYGFKYGGSKPEMLIQDVYNPEDSGDLSDEDYKLKLIKENLETNAAPGVLKINYVSAVTGWAGAVGNGKSPKDFADYLNPRVAEYVSAHTKESLTTGALLFDFVNTPVTEAVVYNNVFKG